MTNDDISLLVFLGLPAGVVTGSGLLLGRAWAWETRMHPLVRYAPFGVIAVIVATLILGVVTREEDVVATTAFVGVLIAWAATLLAFALCVGLGWLVARFVGPVDVVLAVLWTLLLVPALLLALGVLFVIAYTTGCPPNAYECPF